VTAPRVTKVYAVADCKVAPMTADTSGGSTTYGSSVDVPGIKTVEISGDVNVVELRGDNGLMDVETVLTNVQVAVSHAKLSLDALAVMLDATVADSGSGDNEIAGLPIYGTTRPQYFKLEAISVSSDSIGGAVKFTLPKLIISSFPEMGLAEEDYRIVSFQARAVPRLSDGLWVLPEHHETAPTLS
jgi:hypothetical protein